MWPHIGRPEKRYGDSSTLLPEVLNQNLNQAMRKLGSQSRRTRRDGWMLSVDGIAGGKRSKGTAASAAESPLDGHIAGTSATGWTCLQTSCGEPLPLEC